MRLFFLLAAFFASPVLGQQVAPVVPGTQAQPAPVYTAEPAALMIAAFDRDGDARVTRAEFDAGLRHSFDSIDTRHSGALGYIAFSDWSERWLGNRNTLPSPFETDRDGDNRITYAELAARFDLLFARFDADKDGVITRHELLTVRSQSFGRERGRRRDNDIMGTPGQH